MRGLMFDRVCGACDYFLWRYPALEYGPGHVVVSDYNFEDVFVYGCMEKLNGMKTHAPGGHGLDELRALMEWIMTIPEEQRMSPDPEPA